MPQLLNFYFNMKLTDDVPEISYLFCISFFFSFFFSFSSALIFFLRTCLPPQHSGKLGLIKKAGKLGLIKRHACKAAGICMS